MARKSKGKFNMKGHTLPGINQRSETSNIKDGRSPSSAFQMQSPLKEEISQESVDYQGRPISTYSTDEVKALDDIYDVTTPGNDNSGRPEVTTGEEVTTEGTTDGTTDASQYEIDKANIEDGELNPYSYNEAGEYIPAHLQWRPTEAGEDKFTKGLHDLAQAFQRKKWNKEQEAKRTALEETKKREKAEADAEKKEKLEEEKRRQELLDKQKAKEKETPSQKLDDQIKKNDNKPYEVQSGDSLSKIARANKMTLEELLEKNPEYKANPNFVKRGAKINL